MKNDWKFNLKRKLTSRKFWLAVGGFVTALLVIFGVDDITQEQIIGVVSAMSVLVAYIVGEGFADAAHTDDKPEDGDSE